MCRSILVLLCFLIAVIGFIPAPAAEANTSLYSVQATYFASPTGSGTTCSNSSPCSLTGVRDKVRGVNSNMTGNIIVNLKGGTYNLSSALTLDERDSGTNGYQVIWQAVPGETVTIGGFATITGWTLHDSAKNIYKANVSSSLQTRQLYVNNVRAQRAKGANNPSGFTVKQNYGYDLSGSALDIVNYKNLTDVELVDYREWRMFRCKIGSISGSALNMAQPCWKNARIWTTRTGSNSQYDMQAPKWIENAYELLDAEGEWYHDRTGAIDNTTQPKIYYKPRAGETISTATVIAPTLETIIDGAGSSLSTPIQNITIQNVNFAYATWLYPSSTDGYVSNQAGMLHYGQDSGYWYDLKKTHAHVTFKTAKNVTLERNTFKYMGGAAVNFEYGSQNNLIVGNRFEDLSGHAVLLGTMTNHASHPCGDVSSCDSAEIVKNNIVRSNSITKIGQEHFDATGIWAGYTDGTVIERNEIHDIPYTGVSVGWGWGRADAGGSAGYTTDTVSKNNKINYNRIYDYMKILRDGAGIYTLGSQSGSQITNNYVYNGSYAGIYLDNGTQHYNVNNNVVDNIADRKLWLFIQKDVTPYSINNTAQYNFYGKYNGTNLSASTHTNNTVNNNTAGITGTTAVSIINNSGMLCQYLHMKGGTSCPTNWWKLDETGSTTTAIDSAGSRNGTMTNGATWSAGGKSGGAAFFDGVNDYIAIPAILNPQTTNFTFATWVNLSTAMAANQTILQQEGTTGRTILYRNSSGKLATSLGNSETASSGTINLNTWTHVVVVRDGTSVKLYLNGQLDGSATRTVESANGNLRVGMHKSPSTSNEEWAGLIDDLRYYSVALTDNEVLALYNSY